MKKLLIGLLVVAALVAIGVTYAQHRQAATVGSEEATGPIHYQKEAFLRGYYGGTSRQYELNSSGAISTTGGITLGSSGTAISVRKCAAFTWNPASFSSSTVASTTVTNTGYALGDITTGAALATSTSADQWSVTSNGSSTNAIVVQIRPLPGTAAWNAGLDLATTTGTVCYEH